jgi:hypothetical protein
MQKGKGETAVWNTLMDLGLKEINVYGTGSGSCQRAGPVNISFIKPEAKRPDNSTWV